MEQEGNPNLDCYMLTVIREVYFKKGLRANLQWCEGSGTHHF